MFFQQKTWYEILQIHPYMDNFWKGRRFGAPKWKEIIKVFIIQIKGANVCSLKGSLAMDTWNGKILLNSSRGLMLLQNIT